MTARRSVGEKVRKLGIWPRPVSSSASTSAWVRRWLMFLSEAKLGASGRATCSAPWQAVQTAAYILAPSSFIVVDPFDAAGTIAIDSASLLELTKSV